MASQSLPPLRTHPFIDTIGRLLRVVDDGRQPPRLESSSGLFLSPCAETGREILKLASEGRALWNALQALLYNPGNRMVQTAAREVLDQTAATFDHNEPEERPASLRPERLRIREGWDSAGSSGDRLGPDVSAGGLRWTPILFDGCEDPDLHKANALEAIPPAETRARHDPNRPVPLVGPEEVDRADD